MMQAQVLLKPVSGFNTIHPPAQPEIFMMLLLGVGQFPKRVAPLDYSIHPFRNNAQPPSSLSSPLKRLHPFARCCSSAGFSLIHFLWGEIGALIGLFAHGLAIKKLLVTLSLSAQCNHRTRDKVIITVCAGRLKSPLNSVQYKLVHALEGGNGQIIAPSEISLLLSLYHHTGKSH